MTNDSLSTILIVVVYLSLGWLLKHILMKKRSTVYTRTKNEDSSFCTQRHHRNSV